MVPGQELYEHPNYSYTYVVLSSDARTILSSIENIKLWGENCTSVQVSHDINIAYSKPIAEDKLNAQMRLFCNS